MKNYLPRHQTHTRCRSILSSADFHGQKAVKRARAGKERVWIFARCSCERALTSWTVPRKTREQRVPPTAWWGESEKEELPRERLERHADRSGGADDNPIDRGLLDRRREPLFHGFFRLCATRPCYALLHEPAFCFRGTRLFLCKYVLVGLISSLFEGFFWALTELS